MTLANAIKEAMREQYRDTASGRSEPEDAFLWQVTHCSDLPKPERGLKLVAGRSWAFDFTWEKQNIVVEIEGGIWRRHRGGHSSPTGIMRDMAKYNAATRLGYRVFRFTSDQVKNGEALEFIKELF